MKFKILILSLLILICGCSNKTLSVEIPTISTEVLEIETKTDVLLSEISEAFDYSMSFNSIHLVESVEYFSNDISYNNTKSEVLICKEPVMVYESQTAFDYGRIYVPSLDIEGDISKLDFVQTSYNKYGEDGELDLSEFVYNEVRDIILNEDMIDSIICDTNMYTVTLSKEYFESTREMAIKKFNSALNYTDDEDLKAMYYEQIALYESISNEEYIAELIIKDNLIISIDIIHSFDVKVDDITNKTMINFNIQLVKFNDSVNIEQEILGVYNSTQT